MVKKYSIIFICLIGVTLYLSIILPYLQAQDATPVPDVATSVAGTLTALAPTIDSIQPTRLPTSTPTPTPTLTPTITPTLSIEDQVALTITAVFLDANTLDTWVENSNGAKHAFTNMLPEEIRAPSKENADLIVVIESLEVNEDSLPVSGGCGGSVRRIRIDYRITLTNTSTGETLDPHTIRGGSPGRPFLLNSCDPIRGTLPSFSTFFEWLADKAYLLIEPPTLTPTPTRTSTPAS